MTWKEMVAYLTSIAGTVGDHVSTAIALRQPYTYESNPTPAWLMQHGLWLPFDVLTTAAAIVVPALFIKLSCMKTKRCILLWPLIGGIIRLGACVWNLHLI